jgi:NAD-dependent histone deacetylase SIR2
MDPKKRALVGDAEASSEDSEVSSFSDSELYAAALAFVENERQGEQSSGGAFLRQLVAQGLRAEKTADLVAETGCDEDTVIATLLTAVLRGRRERLKRQDINTVDDVVSLIRNSRNILVLCGAGISTSLGIPDFRSEGGIYERVRARYPFLDDPQLLFDLDQFFVDPRPFFEFAAEIFPKEDAMQQTSLCHRFIAQLERTGKLLRCYTQNIDGLERAAGVSKTVFCHGNFETLSCIRCGLSRTIGAKDRQHIRAGEVIYCEQCSAGTSSGLTNQDATSHSSRAASGQETSDDEDLEPEPVMKPGIVFFGESLPQEFFECIENDIRQADLLLVIGTSLQVAPVADIPRHLDPSVPQILVNRELVARSRVHFDVELLGDCEYIIRLLAELLDWSEEIGSADDCPLSKTVVDCFVPPNRYVFQGARLDFFQSEIATKQPCAQEELNTMKKVENCCEGENLHSNGMKIPNEASAVHAADLENPREP